MQMCAQFSFPSSRKALLHNLVALPSPCLRQVLRTFYSLPPLLLPIFLIALCISHPEDFIFLSLVLLFIQQRGFYVSSSYILSLARGFPLLPLICLDFYDDSICITQPFLTHENAFLFPPPMITELLSNSQSSQICVITNH